MQSAQRTSMWREDDFEDMGKQVKDVPKHKVVSKPINDPDIETVSRVEDSDERDSGF